MSTLRNVVYICAFAPDKDESVSTLIADFPADGPQPPILPPGTASRSWTGTNSTPRSPPTCPITEASWRTKPSWYLVTTEDRMIPPPAQHTT
jgi:hypothetical protein